MRKSWSVVLGSVAVATWMLAPACVDTSGGATGTSALTNTSPDDGAPPSSPRGPHGGMDEPPPERPGDPCEERFAELDTCYAIHGELCGALHEDLGACYESQFAPCEALMEAFFDCENAGGACEPLRIQADQCFEHAHVLCAGLEEAAAQCFEPCNDIEREIDRVCREPDCPPIEEPWGSTCDHLARALDQCFFEAPPEHCQTIEIALITVCAGGPELPPGEERPPEEDPEGPPGG